MDLYKTTESGKIELSEQESSELIALWTANSEKTKKEPKTLESRVRDLEKAVALLSK